MRKQVLMIFSLICIISAIFAVSANAESYIFTGNNIAKKSSLEDVENVALTENITVTTQGEKNWKCAGITDVEHNKELGYYPINEDFSAQGSYIFLAAGSTNDDASFVLNLPKIIKGSKVKVSFCKPLITNNGSSRRNSGDPYAYLKIADRYISINGDNFDKWREETVTIGADTEEIEFHCMKWGAVAISEIEIVPPTNEALYNLSVNSTQFANLEVNGIKFYADENGKLSLPSFANGEEITVLAKKDGYKSKEQVVTVKGEDISIDVFPECETDAVYYESDFGNKDGMLTLDTFNLNVAARPITRLFANVTFKEQGKMSVLDENGEEILNIEFKDKALFANGIEITKKDNMEFEVFFDTELDIITLIENDRFFNIAPLSKDIEKISSLSGKSAVNLDYVGISYPDKAKIEIIGPQKVSSLANEKNLVFYNVKPEYVVEGEEFIFTFNGEEISRNPYAKEFAHKDTDNSSTFLPVEIPKGYEGIATIGVTYRGHTATKEIEVIKNPKILDFSHTGKTLNLYDTKAFVLDNAFDEYGNEITDINRCMKDFKSSDESVIKINEKGIMSAVGTGKATISANVFTGVDNIIAVEYTVDNFMIWGAVNEIAYEINDLVEHSNITSYKLIFADGEERDIEISKIPAKTIEENGVIIVSSYNTSGQLLKTTHTPVKKGDKCEISTDTKTVYFVSDNEYLKITDSDSQIDGFKIESDNKTDYSIVPVYTFSNVGDVKEGKTLEAVFDEGRYDIALKKAEKRRADIYVNGYMVGNNVDQSDTDRKLKEGSLYIAEDIKIKNGELTVLMSDGSTTLEYITLHKRPCFRSTRVYIIGDSLACEYYGDFETAVGGGRAGWGQQLGDFLNIPVTNLANSGQYASGLYKTAFPGIIENGCRGDILLIECGYNDRNYSTREEMTACVKAMIRECREKGIIPIIVTPNASEHDYKPSVVWSGYLRDIAVDENCQLIDLSKESYDFLYSLYGDDKVTAGKNFNLTTVGGDTLHSSFAGAYKMAELVAKGLSDLGYGEYVNTEFRYIFTDSLGNEITAHITK